jgi:hypothetical protein
VAGLSFFAIFSAIAKVFFCLNDESKLTMMMKQSFPVLQEELFLPQAMSNQQQLLQVNHEDERTEETAAAAAAAGGLLLPASKRERRSPRLRSVGTWSWCASAGCILLVVPFVFRCSLNRDRGEQQQ